jgi:hypothetical protein
MDIHERWLSRLLEACDVALERVNNPALDIDPQLVADLEDLQGAVRDDLAACRKANRQPS